jgi:hypothetical protein
MTDFDVVRRHLVGSTIATEALDRIEADNKHLAAALDALTMLGPNGQICFRSHNGIPMDMSKKQERLARQALGGTP